MGLNQKISFVLLNVIVLFASLIGGVKLYAEEPWVIEEVVVTAQKKSASARDVPIAMTALGGNDIKDLRLAEATQIESFVTNIDIKGTLGGTNPAITIRGVGLNDFNANNNPSVGVYVDEIFLSSPGMLNFSTFDVERVEVLKGPQGTLYGRNTNGGAINYYSVKPSFDENAYISTTAGDFEVFEIEGAYGNAINDRWAFRVAGKFSGQGENFWENKIGSDFGGSDLAALRASLLFEGEDLSFNSALTVGEQNAGFQPFKNRGFIDPSDPLLGPCPTAATGDPVQDFSCTSILYGVGATFLNVDVETFPNQAEDEATYANNIDQPDTEQDTLLWLGRFDYAMSDQSTLTSITSYAAVDRNYADSVFGSLQGYHYFDSNHEEEITQVTQEFRYTLISESMDWTTGIFYSTDEVDSVTLFNSTDALATLYDVSYEQETTATAFFTQIEYHFNDQWSAELGARYSREERDYVGGTTDLNPFDQSVILYLPVAEGGFGLTGFTGPLPLTAGTRINFDDNDVSGRIGVNYRPDNNWLIYANVSTGYKSGIVFADITFLPEEMGPLDPEEITSFELGFKGIVADDTFQLNGAIFQYDYKDIQTQVPTPLGLTFTNADEADINGAELDIVWRPLIGLDVRAGVSLLDSEFNDLALDGNELPNAPEIQYNMIVRYDQPVGGGLFMGWQLDLKYSDEMFKEATNNQLAQTEDYTVVNARVAFTDPLNSWELALWVDNLTDERYLEHVFVVDFFGITADLYNTPRTYGLTANFNF